MLGVGVRCRCSGFSAAIAGTLTVVAYSRRWGGRQGARASEAERCEGGNLPRQPAPRLTGQVDVAHAPVLLKQGLYFLLPAKGEGAVRASALTSLLLLDAPLLGPST